MNFSILFLFFYLDNCIAIQDNETTIFIKSSDHPYGYIEFLQPSKVFFENPKENVKKFLEITRHKPANGSLTLHLKIEVQINGNYVSLTNSEDICFLKNDACTLSYGITWISDTHGIKNIYFLIKKHGNQWEIKKYFRFVIKTIYSSIEGNLKDYIDSKFYFITVNHL